MIDTLDGSEQAWATFVTRVCVAGPETVSTTGRLTYRPPHHHALVPGPLSNTVILLIEAVAGRGISPRFLERGIIEENG